MNVRTTIRRAAAITAAVATIGMAAACGGDEDQQNVATAGTATTADGGGVAEAERVIAPYRKQPTKIEVSEPITKPVPEGKRITFLTCASPGCLSMADSFKQAAGILGWTAKVQTVDAVADKINKAYDTAIRDKPDGVAVVAVSSEVARNKLGQLEKLGIPVVTAQDPDKPFGPIIASLYTQHASQRTGGLHAANMIASGCGKGPVIYVHVGGFIVLEHMLTGFKEQAAKLAPDMEIEVVDIAATQETNAQAAIVGAVRSSKATCVLASSDPLATGLPQALKGAGVTNLPKIFTDYGAETTLQYIQDGLATGTNVGDPHSFGFLFADAFARHFAGQSVDPSAEAYQSNWFVDAENAPEKIGKTPIANFEEQYKQLWGK